MAEAPGTSARHLARLDPRALAARGLTAAPADVAAAIGRDRLRLSDLAVLLSPAAGEALEPLALRARALTRQRFGQVVRLFAPLYLSNACLSTCTYCGFARQLSGPRDTLDPDRVEQEARVLVGRGFRHLLLVAGEHRGEVGPEYLLECVRRLRDIAPSLAIETQTWSRDVYHRLVTAGLEGVVHYQETYDRERYRTVHPSGWKRDYDRRVNAMDAAGEAGARRLGIGALLGLSADWRADVLAVAAHARLLQQRYWGAEVTVSLPRITPSGAGFRPEVTLDDAGYLQALAALRLFLPTVGIVLSTREPAALRDGLVRISVTHLSAGSSTEPGGYTTPGSTGEQFSVIDQRPVRDVERMLTTAGYEPVFLDALPLAAASPSRTEGRRQPVAAAAAAWCPPAGPAGT